MFDDLAPFTDPDRIQPFVYEDARTLAMHFDITATQSRMHLDDPYRLELDYTRAMMGFLLLQPAPLRILAIGLGGGSLPKYCHRYLPESDITVVEINPHVIAMRDTFHVPAEGPRFRVVQGDGACFVRDSVQQHDVILLDGFTYDGQPEALCSLAFYDACRSALTPAGVLSVNLHEDPPLTEIWCDRIGQAFEGAMVAFKADGGSNRVVLAAAATTLAEAAEACEARWQALAPVHRDTLQAHAPRVASALAARKAQRAGPLGSAA